MRTWIPGGILGAWALLAISVYILPLSPNLIQLEHILVPPGEGALLGYDDLGRDIGQRLLVGARTSFLVAFWVVGLSALLGTLIGTVSAYLGGWWDRVVVQVIDIFLAFPGILLAIALAGLLGPGIENVVVALAAVGWVGYARLSRAQVLSLKHREHVRAAEALGSGRLRIMTRHLLPLMMAPLIVEATFGVAAVVIAEAGLSFLGLGVQPPTASWGSMVADGRAFMLEAWWVSTFPGLAILLLVLAINVSSQGLRDAFDPKFHD